MSKPRDPGRLENGGSAELKELIDALRDDSPNRASMQRMAQRLESTFETAPATGAAVSALSRRLLGKLGLALLASAALLVAVAHVARHSGKREPDALATPAPPALGAAPQAPAHEPQPTPATGVRPTSERVPDPHPSSAGFRAEAVEPARSVRARSPRRARGARLGAATHRVAPAQVAEPAPASHSVRAQGTGALTPTQSRDSLPPARAASNSSDPDTAPTPPAQSAHEAVATTRPSSEAAMLQRAQRLAGNRPDEALRILSEHARVYPNGILAPEREVLAIQILRAQSRTSEARRRLAAFRERYPNSLYLERLGRTEAARSPDSPRSQGVQESKQ